MANIKIFISTKKLITNRAKVVAILPFHHVYPFTCTVLAPLYFGATLIYPRSLKGEDIFGSLKKHRGTILIAVPRLLELFCNEILQKVEKSPKRKKILFYSLLGLSTIAKKVNIKLGKLFFFSIHKNFPGFRYFACGGARLDTRVHKKLTLLGFKVLEAYGLTETAPIVTINRLKHPMPGSAGRAAEGVSLRIEKDDPQLEYGEICIRGPNVMMGYYKRPDLTEKTVIDGWFHSGDLGFLDNKKNLFITGRKKEVLVLPNGKNIYPEELETFYQQSEKIKEFCITLLSERDRTLLTAVIYPNKEYFVRNKSTTVYQDIKFEIENIAQKLPPYKRVSRIELVDEELPKTSLGKIKRYKVTELFKNRMSASPTVTRMVPHEDLDPFLIFVKEVLKLKHLPQIKNNLETDLGLDSLSKLEFLSVVEKKFGIKIEEDQAAGFFTLEDVKRVIPEIPQEEHMFEGKPLEDELLTPPEPPLEKHVSVGNNLLSITSRYCFYIFCKVFFKLFFRARLEGRETLKALKPPFIIAPNHNSYIDALVIYGLFPFEIINNCLFISLPLYFNKFPLSLFQRIGRIILTGTYDTTVTSLKYSYQALKSKKVLCVFPEGKRSLDGNIEEPKEGFGQIARLASACLLPVCIEGTQALYSRRNPGFHLAPLKVRIFPPIHTNEVTSQFLSKWKRVLQNCHNK